MGLGLIKPGMRSANLTGMRHPRTGEFLKPLGVLKNGTLVWPVIGAAPDDEDPDDPTFTGSGGSDEDDDDSDDDEDDDEDEKPKKPKTKKSKSEDNDEDEDDDPKPTRPERQAARYRVKLRETEKTLAELQKQLKAIQDKDKPADELIKRDADEARTKAEKLAAANRNMVVELAFFKSNTIDWIDPADALRLVDLDDVEVDDDGTVDSKALRVALKDLAKRKPHLVKKPRTASEDDDTDDDEPGSRRSAPPMNSKRRGGNKKSSREELMKSFPVLGRL